MFRQLSVHYNPFSDATPSTFVANRGIELSCSHGLSDVVLENGSDAAPKRRGDGDAAPENVSSGTEGDKGAFVCSVKGSCGDIILQVPGDAL